MPTLPLLDWDELGRLHDQGVQLGAHSRSHRHLTNVSGDELTEEICGAAADIQRNTGVTPVGFAYPYGSVSKAASGLITRTYSWGCTTELRVLRGAEERSRIPRLDMYYFRNAGLLERWGTARFTYYLKLRAHARRVRQRLAS